MVGFAARKVGVAQDSCCTNVKASVGIMVKQSSACVHETRVSSEEDFLFTSPEQKPKKKPCVETRIRSR